MLKKLFLSAVLCTASMVAMAQSQIITHVVQRGETLESIVKYYNISVADLNNANPNADGIIYVGMKLAVPVSATTVSTTSSTITTPATTASTTTDSSTSTSSPNSTTYHTAQKWKPWMFKTIVGATFGTWTGKDFKEGNTETEYGEGNVKNKSAFKFHIGLVADYYFTKNLYTGLGVVFNQSGYRQDCTMTSGEYWDDEGANYDAELKTKMTVNKFDIPVHIGYMYNFSDCTKIFAEAGVYATYAISGSKKQTGYVTEYEDVHSSATEHIDETTKIGKKDLKDYKKFGYGLSATIGTSFKKVILQFTYQRGLNKTIKKTKQYEQNMLLSLGYEF